MTKEEEFESKWGIFIDRIKTSTKRVAHKKVLKVGENYFACAKGSMTEYNIIHFRETVYHDEMNAYIRWKKIVIPKIQLKQAYLYDRNNKAELHELKEHYAKLMEEISEGTKNYEMRQLVRETYIDDEIIEKNYDDIQSKQYFSENIFMLQNIEALNEDARETKKQFEKLVREGKVIKIILKYFDTIKV